MGKQGKSKHLRSTRLDDTRIRCADCGPVEPSCSGPEAVCLDFRFVCIRVHSWFSPFCLSSMKAQVFEIAHTTVYEYHSPVTVSHHLMRLSPRFLSRQRRLTHDIEVDPVPAVVNRRVDYFGNDTTFATIEGTHRRLRVTSRSRVAIRPAFIPEAGETPGWET